MKRIQKIIASLRSRVRNPVRLKEAGLGVLQKVGVAALCWRRAHRQKGFMLKLHSVTKQPNKGDLRTRR